MNSKFKKDDLITGVDRSYPRSIYRYLGDAVGKSGHGLLMFVAFQGFIQSDISEGQTLTRETSEFRIATPSEILEAHTRQRPKRD